MKSTHINNEVKAILNQLNSLHFGISSNENNNEMRNFGKNLTNCKTSKISNPNLNSAIKNVVGSVASLQRYHYRNLQRFSWTANLTLNLKQSNIREKLFKWLITYCESMLELRLCTCQHAMRLFDHIIWIQHSLNQSEVCRLTECNSISSILYSKASAQLYLISCLFISAKYLEIYPPTLSDFIYVVKEQFSTQQILQHQRVILALVNFQLNQTLMSDWYRTIYQQQTPTWAFYTLPELPININMNILAQEIHQNTILNVQQDRTLMKNVIKIMNQSIDQNDN